MVGQVDRQVLIGGEVVGDEFGELHGVQQACAGAAGEAVAEQGEDGEAGPKCAACGGAAVERGGVEEQVGQAVAREVAVER